MKKITVLLIIGLKNFHARKLRKAKCEKRNPKFKGYILPFAFCFFFFVFGVSVPSHTLSQCRISSAPLVDSCQTNIQDSLAREHRLYRRVLFGLSRAADEDNGATRNDKEGNTWFKSDTNTWRSQAKGFENTTWSDTLMDIQVERDPLQPTDGATFRRGIFGTRGVLTSELIPPLTQSFRALQCRTYSVCEAVARSLTGEKPVNGMYMIKIPGCRELPVHAPTSCTSSDGGALSVFARGSAMTSCSPMVEALLARESEMLTLSVTYDAAYRSLLQFAGTFDDFLSVFRLDLLRPIRQSLPLLQQLGRIPCFLSQCNG